MIKILMATYHRAVFLNETLRSLGEQFEDNRQKCRLYVYDNASGDDVKDLLEAFRKRFPEYVAAITYGDRNIGKARGLNSFIPEIEDEDMVCSFDSDLLIAESMGKAPCELFFECGSKAVRHGDASVVVPNQSGNGRHLAKMEWIIPHNGTDEDAYTEVEFGLGVAGGCLFTKGSTYKAVGGYRENRGLFGGNDGYFLLDASRHESKPIHIYRHLVVWHPFDADEAYAKWKEQAQEQQLAHQRCLSYKGFYD